MKLEIFGAVKKIKLFSVKKKQQQKKPISNVVETTVLYNICYCIISYLPFLPEWFALFVVPGNLLHAD